jgi:acetyl esterase
VRDWYVTVPGREVPIRIYRPSGTESLPVVVYFHGGGWVNGSLDTHDGMTAGIASTAGVAVVAVHYRRTPENPHPAAVEDGLAVLHWLQGADPRFCLDHTRITIAGDSAGGHITAALSLLARREGIPGLRLQVMIYPAIDPDFTTDSYRDNAQSPFLATTDVQHYWHLYMPNGFEGDPVAYPMHSEDLSGLPPALIINAQYDPLRDDGIHYGQRLQAAGTEVEVRTVEGMIHGFLRARFMSPPAMQEFEIMCARIRARLA